MIKSAHSRKNTLNLFKIAFLANTFEWYEFSIFSFLSATIGKLFFESDRPITELLKVFTLFAVSYLIRPLGSLFFGILGDKRGRRYALNLSLILMAVPTVFIGLLPTYKQAGLIATCILIGLRMLQAFATGGELPATACYIFEASSPKYRSLLCSAAGTATKIGLLLGSLTAYLLTCWFDEDKLLSYGWRIPFLISIPLTLFITYIRQTVQETSTFSKMNGSDNFSTYLRDITAPLIQAIALCSFATVGIYVLTIWMPFYLNQFLNVPLHQANLISTLTLGTMVPLCLGIGYLSQYIGYKKLFINGIIATIVLIIPLFKGLQTYSQSAALLAIGVMFAVLMSFSQGLFVEATNHLFEPRNRSLGVSLAITLPAAVIGGPTPLILTYIIHKTGWLMFPAFYIMAFALLALPIALKLKN